MEMLWKHSLIIINEMFEKLLEYKTFKWPFVCLKELCPLPQVYILKTKNSNIYWQDFFGKNVVLYLKIHVSGVENFFVNTKAQGFFKFFNLSPISDIPSPTKIVDFYIVVGLWEKRHVRFFWLSSSFITDNRSILKGLCRCLGRGIKFLKPMLLAYPSLCIFKGSILKFLVPLVRASFLSDRWGNFTQ